MTLTILATNPSSDLYGASRMALESVHGFRAEGWDVVVTLPTGGPLADAAEAVGARVRLCPTPVLRKGDLSPLGLLRLLWRTLRAVPPGIRLVRQVRPDVVYVNTITEPLWLVLARVMRIPVLCHVHEGESQASPRMRRLLALPLLLAHRLVANSRFSLQVVTDAIPRLGARGEVVYNGVAGPPSATPPRTSIEPPVQLLYVGRLSERKGVQDAVGVVAALDRRGTAAELHIVGSAYQGYEWVERDVRARAADLGHRVHLHGFDPDVWPHLAAADVLLVPSRVDEPFGNTAVEGVLAARPVVTTRTGGLVEAVEGMAAATVVEPGDVEALADAVADLVARWADVRALALADAERAAARFAPEGYRAALCRAAAALAQS